MLSSVARVNLRFVFAMLLVAGGSIMATMMATQSQAEEKPKERVFEMRVYIAHEGKLEDLHKRFRDHTNKLFVKHGMELVGYWTPNDDQQKNPLITALNEDPKQTLVYILAYPSREAAAKSWAAFRDDADWKKAYAESHKNGPLVKKVISQYLAPTDYSPIK